MQRGIWQCGTGMLLLSAAIGHADLASVDEAWQYIPIYQLQIANSAQYNSDVTGSTPVPYTLDRSATAPRSFDRIAYYVELDTGSGPQWVYASMDAFTDDPTKIGVPTRQSGANWQQNVTNMNVRSNAAGIVTGNAIATGNIEFWPNNYQPNNTGQNAGLPAATNVPNASETVFDTGDRQSGGGYGSMQLHNHAAAADQTLFAYNRWGGTSIGNSDLGIGNRTTSHPDWTFAANAAAYTSKQMQVLVRPNVYANVPEANDNYHVVYALNIPQQSPGYGSNPVPYALDRSADFDHFDRVAYYVELEDSQGNSTWVYASMDAFTTDASKLGVPTHASGALFQQIVSNMNVYSNSPNITTGTGIQTGNIEFWPDNYGQANGIGIPNASGSTFDFGDTRNPNFPGHGSMQIHNHDIDGSGPGTTGQTLFAYNAWGGVRTSELGIGTNTTGTGNPDWTFNTANIGNYTVRSMYVLVHIPEPGAVSLLAMAGLLRLRRRSR